MYLNYLILRVKQGKRLHHDCSNNQPSLLTMLLQLVPNPSSLSVPSVIDLTSVRCVLLYCLATYIIYLFTTFSATFPLSFSFFCLYLPSSSISISSNPHPLTAIQFNHRKPSHPSALCFYTSKLPCFMELAPWDICVWSSFALFSFILGDFAGGEGWVGSWLC